MSTNVGVSFPGSLPFRLKLVTQRSSDNFGSTLFSCGNGLVIISSLDSCTFSTFSCNLSNHVIVFFFIGKIILGCLSNYFPEGLLKVRYCKDPKHPFMSSPYSLSVSAPIKALFHKRKLATQNQKRMENV